MSIFSDGHPDILDFLPIEYVWDIMEKKTNKLINKRLLGSPYSEKRLTIWTIGLNATKCEGVCN